MSAIQSARRLAPLRTFDHRSINQTFEELNAIIRELHIQVAEARGIAGPESMSLGRHLDMGGKRLQGVGPTRAETDVPNVRELRDRALYATDQTHKTTKLIEAHGGIRTITPAVAPNDVITLGQVQRLISGVPASGTSTSNVGSSSDPVLVASPDAAWAYPQQNVTLPNGLTSDWAIPVGVYFRLTGPTAAFAIGGMQDVADGRFVILHHATGQEMTLVNEDAATPAAHRILTGIGGDMTMSGVGLTQFLYSLADARWMVL